MPVVTKGGKIFAVAKVEVLAIGVKGGTNLEWNVEDEMTGLSVLTTTNMFYPSLRKNTTITVPEGCLLCLLNLTYPECISVDVDFTDGQVRKKKIKQWIAESGSELFMKPTMTGEDREPLLAVKDIVDPYISESEDAAMSVDEAYAYTTVSIKHYQSV